MVGGDDMAWGRFWSGFFVILLSPLAASAVWLLIGAGASTVLFLLKGDGVTRTEFVFLFLTFIDLYAEYLVLWVPFAWLLIGGGSAVKWYLQRRGVSSAEEFFPEWPVLSVGGLLCFPVAFASASLPIEGEGIVPLLTATGVILCFTTSLIFCGLQAQRVEAKKSTR